MIRASMMTICCSALLIACGGGGSSSDQSSSSSSASSFASAEGLYQGASSNGRTFSAVVLENGELWSIYGVTTNKIMSVYGFIQGAGQSTSANTYTSNALKDFGVNPAISTSINATYSAGETISGTLQQNGGAMTIGGAAPVNSMYNYNTPADLSALKGSWYLSSTTGYPATITISDSGAISGSSSGCAITGQATPRASGKNVFNITVKYGASPCLLANQTLNGIGLAYQVSSTQKQLVAAVTNSNRTIGHAMFGVK